MSVRDKLVELAYVRWELREREQAREQADAALSVRNASTPPRKIPRTV
jgi:hypothetical protein